MLIFLPMLKLFTLLPGSTMVRLMEGVKRRYILREILQYFKNVTKSFNHGRFELFLYCKFKCHNSVGLFMLKLYFCTFKIVFCC